MLLEFGPAAWLGALLIFVLRIGDMSLDTIRMLYVVRGRKLLAGLLGFFQALIFETDPEAFITAEDVRAVRRGFWRA